MCLGDEDAVIEDWEIQTVDVKMRPRRINLLVAVSLCHFQG